MPEPRKHAPMICPKCGAVMNHHAEKLVEPRDAIEASRMDARLGGMILEVHGCPACGTMAARAGE